MSSTLHINVRRSVILFLGILLTWFSGLTNEENKQFLSMGLSVSAASETKPFVERGLDNKHITEQIQLHAA